MSLIEEKQSLTEIYNSIKSNSIASMSNMEKFALYRAKGGTKNFPNKETDTYFKTKEYAIKLAGYQMYYYLYLNIYKELIKRKLIKEETRINQFSGGSMNLTIGSVTSIELVDVFAQEFNNYIQDKRLVELLNGAYGDRIQLGRASTANKGKIATVRAKISINGINGSFEMVDNGYNHEWVSVKQKIYRYVDVYIRKIYTTKDERYMALKVLDK